jgi:PAS domain S-box-containing protein
MSRMIRKSSLLPYSAGLIIVCVALLFAWPGLVQNLFTHERFMTHFHCYAQIRPLVALHFYSDLLIGLSYVSISLTLTYLVYRARRDIPFHWVFLAFGLFIIACGGTHFMEVWTTYREPVYWLAGYVKLITAVASVATAVVLPPLVPRTLALVREVTKRRSEAASTAIAFRETNETLAAIIQASPLAIVVLDPAGIVKLWNAAAERIYGWREQEVLNRPLPSVPPERETEMRRNHAAGMAGRSFSNLETTRLRKDGTTMEVSISTAPLHDASGQTTGVLALVADITERKRAAAAQAFLADATSALAASLDYEQTLDSLARLAVPALADFFLVDLCAEETGALERIVVAHRDPERAAAWREMQRRWPLDMSADYTIPQVIRTGQPIIYGEVNEAALRTFLTDEEQIRTLLSFDVKSSIIVPLTARGRTFGALSFIAAESGRRYDAHDLALAEELARRAALAVDNARLYRRAQEANRAKDEFLATLSHELRTPLTPIIGWTHMLGRGQMSVEELRHGLGVIDKNSQSLARLINDLLDMSAILNGKMRIDRLLVTVEHVLTEAVETVRPEARQRGIEIELTDSGATMPVMVMGDRTRLGQVCWNLINNAVKFSHKGGRVSVSCTADDGHVRIHVADEGIGIEPEFLPHVFERFRQADMSTTKAHGGLGIGLALVKSFVEAHGGTVRAESAGASRGSRFVVTLPRLDLTAAPAGNAAPPPTPPPAQPTATTPPAEPASQQTAAEPASQQAGPARTSEPPRVLLVEDAPDTLELLRVVFAGRGYRVTACATSGAALDVAARESFDIIVSDIGLPHIDGYALLARLRAEHAPLRAVPAVALTGYAAAQDVAAARAAGFADHVAKPVEPAVLLRMVERLLAQHDAADQT